MEPLDLAIVIVNWNGRAMLADCLHSIAAGADHLRYRIYVVDNGSSDGSQAMLRREFPHVILREPDHNLGFAGGNNVALREILARSDTAPPFVLLLNPDTIVQPGALQALLHEARANPRIGVAGALLLNLDGSFQASYVDFPSLRQEFLILSGLGRNGTARTTPRTA
ncbi:MAG: glycosyltransferase family 2 protein [Oscillochloris sp.]|nr:glycosyltransferase family 2 protein [Oscillochloris sp.]